MSRSLTFTDIAVYFVAARKKEDHPLLILQEVCCVIFCSFLVFHISWIFHFPIVKKWNSDKYANTVNFSPCKKLIYDIFPWI